MKIPTCLLPVLVLILPVLASANAPLPPPVTEKFRAGPWEDDFGYRAAVRVGNTVYVSGCTGAGPMPDAIRRAYAGVRQALKHYGLDASHVVKETVFTTDMDALKQHRDVRKAFYGSDFPASSWIGTNRLFEPAYVIEVEVIAMIPEAKP